MGGQDRGTCPLCGLLVARRDDAHTRMTSEGPRWVHDRCAGQQTRIEGNPRA